MWELLIKVYVLCKEVLNKHTISIKNVKEKAF